jgi:hypothetical protein
MSARRRLNPSTTFFSSFARRILENLGLVQRLMQSCAHAERLGSYSLKWLKRFWLPTGPRDQLDCGMWSAELGA